MEDLELDEFELELLAADGMEPEEISDAETAVEMELLLGRVQAARRCGA